jgi:hypothetical protein
MSLGRRSARKTDEEAVYKRVDLLRHGRVLALRRGTVERG